MEAKALLAIPRSPAASERNGYVDLLGLGVPEPETPYATGLKVLDALKAQDRPGFKGTPEWQAQYKLGSSLLDLGKYQTLRCRPDRESCRIAP